MLLKLLSFGLITKKNNIEKSPASYITFLALFIIIYSIEAFLMLLALFYAWDIIYKSNVPLSIANNIKFPILFYIIYMTVISIKKFKLKKSQTQTNKRKSNYSKSFIILTSIFAGIILIIGLRNLSTNSKLSSKKKINRNEAQYTRDITQEKQIKESYAKLEELQNERNFEQIYSIFYPPSYVSRQNKYYSQYQNDKTGYPYFHDYYLDTISKYFKDEQIQKIHFDINQIRFIENKAFVNRVMTTCFDVACTKVSTQTASIKWIKNNENWYTSQEVPLCVKNQAFNVPASIPGLTNFSLKDSEIQIITTLECDMFPINWIIESQIDGSPLSEERINKDVELTKMALNKYPKLLISNNLARVYILNNLYTNKILRGGMNSNDIIAIIDEGIEKDYSKTFIENSIHHEIAHILVEKYEQSYNKDTTKLYLEEWDKINPPDFIYEADKYRNLDDVFKETTMDFSPELNKIGFLTKYSTYDMKEDFIITSSWLFMGSKDFWNIIDNNNKLYLKVKLAIEFYKRLDPSLNETYFRSLKSN